MKDYHRHSVDSMTMALRNSLLLEHNQVDILNIREMTRGIQVQVRSVTMCSVFVAILVLFTFQFHPNDICPCFHPLRRSTSGFQPVFAFCCHSLLTMNRQKGGAQVFKCRYSQPDSNRNGGRNE